MVLPSAVKPRLLVSAAHPRAGASAVLRHGDASALSARLQRQVLALALRAHVGPQVYPAGFWLDSDAGPTITDRLAEIMNQPVAVTLALTPRRANRKPVLHLLDLRGRTLAFVKIGINPLTRALVRGERDALLQLANLPLPSMRVPEVIHTGEWQDLELLVLSALPTWEGKPPSAGLVGDAMRELAATREQPRDAPPANYAGLLAQRAQEIEPRTPREDHAVLAQLRQVAEILAAHEVTAALTLGPWHGDWTSWNCRQLGPQLLVWDWERYAADVPAGFDALHFALNQAVVGDHVPHRKAAQDCLVRAPEILAPWGMSREVAQTVAALYLVELGLRYIVDEQRTQGGFGGDVAAWIAPALHEHISNQQVGKR
jgi:phosphotransferase family enzyme